MFHLPGGHRQRSRARNILKAERITESNWRVSGGQNEHTVMIEGVFGKYEYICDCGFVEKECSHILCVMLQTEPERMDYRRYEYQFKELKQKKYEARLQKKRIKQKSSPPNIYGRR